MTPNLTIHASETFKKAQKKPDRLNLTELRFKIDKIIEKEEVKRYPTF